MKNILFKSLLVLCMCSLLVASEQGNQSLKIEIVYSGKDEKGAASFQSVPNEYNVYQDAFELYNRAVANNFLDIDSAERVTLVVEQSSNSIFVSVEYLGNRVFCDLNKFPCLSSHARSLGVISKTLGSILIFGFFLGLGAFLGFAAIATSFASNRASHQSKIKEPLQDVNGGKDHLHDTGRQS